MASRTRRRSSPPDRGSSTRSRSSIDAADWTPLEVGLAQRTELLNAILVDLYGPQRLLRRGVLPPALVFGHSGFLRVAARASAQDPWPLLLAAADLGRNAAGEWQVIADRAQAPSGIGFAMENRRVISRVMPELYRQASTHRMAPFFQALRTTLMEAAPNGDPDPRVVVLSPGTHSETSYDQAFVASMLGFPLVEGSDLVMREGAVWVKVFGRLERVDVILRRVDAAWSDALELRKNSQLGVAGLSEAVRRGTVRVVNGLGAGVLENPGLLPFMSAMCETLLDEPLRIPSVQTYWCGIPRSQAFVDDNIEDLVIKAIDNPVDLSHLSPEALRDLIRAEPHRYVGQETLSLSQAPSYGARGIRPQALTLRTFTLRYGSTYRPLIGGLANVFESGQAASSKDVWVLKDSPEDADQGLAEVLPMTQARATAAMVPRVLEDMFWFGRYSERAEDMLRLVLAAHASAEDNATRPHSGRRCEPRRAARARSPGSAARRSSRSARCQLPIAAAGRQPRRVGGQSVSSLREAAQSVRDQLSPDVWHAFSSTERAIGAVGLQLQPPGLRERQPHADRHPVAARRHRQHDARSRLADDQRRTCRRARSPAEPPAASDDDGTARHRHRPRGQQRRALDRRECRHPPPALSRVRTARRRARPAADGRRQPAVAGVRHQRAARRTSRRCPARPARPVRSGCSTTSPTSWPVPTSPHWWRSRASADPTWSGSSTATSASSPASRRRSVSCTSLLARRRAPSDSEGRNEVRGVAPDDLLLRRGRQRQPRHRLSRAARAAVAAGAGARARHRTGGDRPYGGPRLLRQHRDVLPGHDGPQDPRHPGDEPGRGGQADLR